MTDTPGRKPRQGNLPVWNQYAFDCPGCGRHFAPITIRIIRYNGDWCCHRCQIAATERQAPTKGIAVTSPSEQLQAELCHTCRQPFGTRRIIVNRHGHHVHYRCPKKQATL